MAFPMNDAAFEAFQDHARYARALAVMNHNRTCDGIVTLSEAA